MQVQFKLKIGQNEFILTESVENHSEFFQKLHFYSTLPQVGPNGEDDLVLTFRVAQNQYEYYSIVSKKAGLEYKFGQSKKNDGTLFGKGWEPLYNAGNSAQGDDGSEEQSNVAPGQSVGLGAPAAQPAAAKVAPATKPASAGLGAAAPAATKQPTPAAAPASAPPANAQVANQAKSVLSKFGI